MRILTETMATSMSTANPSAIGRVRMPRMSKTAPALSSSATIQAKNSGAGNHEQRKPTEPQRRSVELRRAGLTVGRDHDRLDGAGRP